MPASKNTGAASAISEVVMSNQKKRVISGVFIALITALCVLFGGVVLDAMLTFIGVYGSYEFIHIRKDSFDYDLFVIMAVSIIGVFAFNPYAIPILLLDILILLTIAVFNEKKTFDDACTVFLMIALLGYAIYFMRDIQHSNKWMYAYVLIIPYMTDVFAYEIGIRFGKHKLNSRVSPNKTIEGSLGGLFFGFLISFLWALAFRFFGLPWHLFLIASLLLPIVSEIGDLAFSLIKRNYGVKDFSQLIPGHGGILDRLDSHFFCIILFGVLMIIFA